MRLILTNEDRRFFADCARKGNNAMTPEQRTGRARKAANARWGRTDGRNKTKQTDESKEDGRTKMNIYVPPEDVPIVKAAKRKLRAERESMSRKFLEFLRQYVSEPAKETK